MKPQPGRQRPLTRSEQLWAAARALASEDGGQRWELEPPVAVMERRRAALPQCEGGPFTPEEQQWLLDTPCQEVLNQVHVKEVGGSTKAAQAAAAIAQQRRPAGPHRLVTWRHIHTGASLVVEVPLSVFRKQRGAVFRKWQQRAWRALYALRCEAGEEVWPEGCREAAAAGAPCWDDLEEETAALAKLPFCMPQKCKVQLLGLGTIKRFKSEVLGKRKNSEREEPAAPNGAEKRAQNRMRAAMWMGQEWLLSAQHKDDVDSQQPQLQGQQSGPAASAQAPSPQPPTPQKLQQPYVAFDARGMHCQGQQPEGLQQQHHQRREQREEHGRAELQPCQQRQPGWAAHQGQLDCNTPTAVQEQTSCLTALFDDIAMAAVGDAAAEGTSPMRALSRQPSTREPSAPIGGAGGTPSSRHPGAGMLFSVEERAVTTPVSSSWLTNKALLMEAQEERSPVSSLKELFHHCTSQGGAAGGTQPGAQPDPQLMRNCSQGSLASGLECASHMGLQSGGRGGAAGPATHCAQAELPSLPEADRMLLRIGSSGSSSCGFNGAERGAPAHLQEVGMRSTHSMADLAGGRPGSAGGAELGRTGSTPSPGLGQHWLPPDSRHRTPSGLQAQGWALPAAAEKAAGAGRREAQRRQERAGAAQGAAANGWAGAADWLLQWSEAAAARASRAGGWQAGRAAGLQDAVPGLAGQPSRGVSAFCFESSLDLLLQGCTPGSALWQGKGSPRLDELLLACSPGGAAAGGRSEGTPPFRGEASLGPWLLSSGEAPEQQQQGAGQGAAAAPQASTLQRLLMAAAVAATKGDHLQGAKPAGPEARAASWQDDVAKLLREVGQCGAAGAAGTAAFFEQSPAQGVNVYGAAGQPSLTATERRLPGRNGNQGPAAQQLGRRKRVSPYINDFMSDAEFHDILDQLFSS